MNSELIEALAGRCAIYAIRNIVDGKQYVGSAVNMKRRLAIHNHQLRLGKHHSRKLQHAWDKYGDECFEFVILEIVEDRCVLIEREQVWLDQTDAAASGYNISPQASSSIGIKRSPETRARVSAAVSRLADCPTVKARLSAAAKLQMQNQENRRLLSDTQKRRWADPEIRARQLISIKNAMSNPEVRAKISAARTGQKASAETILKLKARPHPPHSPETRAKMSASAMGHGCSDETRAKIRAANLGRKPTEEQRAKMRAAAMARRLRKMEARSA